MLIVLVGARGAGKTTLQDDLKRRGVAVLQPSTTRKRRFCGEIEYDFVKTWDSSLYAWRIPVGTYTYGMRTTELEKAKYAICVTVFEPLNLEVFERIRRSFTFETITVGLNTLENLSEQHRRVSNDATRTMDSSSFHRATAIVSECDVVLTGDAGMVAEALNALIRLQAGRGGVVTKDFLEPLICAGSLLSGAELSKIHSASYDLRVGHEILCQGRVVELTQASPHFEIPAYSYAIVSTLEHASLPPFVIGRFDLKVSYFFEGIILSNGPQVDPGYKGALFCMLYNGSGLPRVLTLGKHFATIDFTTTTSITEGYRQKYQLKQRMAQFATEQSLAGRGGAIVELIDEKIGVVDDKVKGIRSSFWTIAAAFIAIGVLAPAIIVPVAWIEIQNLHAEKLAIEDAHHRSESLLDQIKQEQMATEKLLEHASQLHLTPPPAAPAPTAPTPTAPLPTPSSHRF
jgi:deoxycytidine triphosphate deaminase